MADSNPSQMKLPEKKSKLSMESTIKLVDWLRKQELIDTTVARIATAAEAALGFRVTDNNVRAALEAAGLRITAAASLEERNAAKLDAIADAIVIAFDNSGRLQDIPRSFVEAFGEGFIENIVDNRQ